MSSDGRNPAATGDEDLKLKKGIADLYDGVSGSWEDVVSDHIHHGFYDPNKPETFNDHRAAQIRMIEESLRFAGISDNPRQRPKNVVDVGCGLGGSSRHLANKYGCKCHGITLSPVQAERAQALANAQNLGDKAFFQVADALDQPFADGQFDLVWSMESGEYMPDKKKFLSELVRVGAPGATIIIVSWCHRDLLPFEESLRPDEEKLLSKICDAFYHPPWCSAADYITILNSLPVQDIKAADWSEYVAPFWPGTIGRFLTLKGLFAIMRSGWKGVKGTLAMPMMVEGYKKGVIKLAIITCRKPA